MPSKKQRNRRKAEAGIDKLRRKRKKTRKRKIKRKKKTEEEAPKEI